MPGNRVDELEARVSELETAVSQLNEDLVALTERVHELEAEDSDDSVNSDVDFDDGVIVS